MEFVFFIQLTPSNFLAKKNGDKERRKNLRTDLLHAYLLQILMVLSLKPCSLEILRQQLMFVCMLTEWYVT